MKTDVQYLEFFWPMRHFLISCGDMQGKSNIIAVSFCMPVSKVPPLIAFAIGKSTFSYRLISDLREAVVNVPLQELTKEIYYCGYHSGYHIDKFKETGLTALPARNVTSPIIHECVAHMECKVINEIPAGDKVLFIGEVIEAYADAELIKGKADFVFAKGDFPKKIYSTRKNLITGYC